MLTVLDIVQVQILNLVTYYNVQSAHQGMVSTLREYQDSCEGGEIVSTLEDAQ